MTCLYERRVAGDQTLRGKHQTRRRNPAIGPQRGEVAAAVEPLQPAPAADGSPAVQVSQIAENQKGSRRDHNLAMRSPL